MLGGGVAVASAVALSATGTASAEGNRKNLADESAIRQLSINYALGTDAIAVGDVDAATALYGATFTPDAQIGAGFDPSSPSLVANGPTEWADVVIEAFRPYTATQHLLGTINIVHDPTTANVARMTTYLHATHVFRENLDLLIVLGTYNDVVAWLPKVGWRITERFLQFTSFSTTQRSAPPAS